VAQGLGPEFKPQDHKKKRGKKKGRKEGREEERKYPTQNRAGRVTQVVQCLPSKPDILSSNPTTIKKQQAKQQKKQI
jgi:hypothetical protein